ncbi:hypothetical protein E2C01_021297 [Portunus trituberculatus]|uniref:Uncharacterized protein n=1 Tax=Portunus trituberculatus TaxID=210409 RepID=A0A5B7E246_PORTR|nr:hypothetical protein [Portunus trituberculatus]
MEEHKRHWLPARIALPGNEKDTANVLQKPNITTTSPSHHHPLIPSTTPYQTPSRSHTTV